MNFLFIKIKQWTLLVLIKEKKCYGTTLNDIMIVSRLFVVNYRGIFENSYPKGFYKETENDNISHIPV